jgi:hypothetical protein
MLKDINPRKSSKVLIGVAKMLIKFLVQTSSRKEMVIVCCARVNRCQKMRAPKKKRKRLVLKSGLAIF